MRGNIVKSRIGKLMDYKLLENIPLFRGLTKDEMERVLQLAFVKDYKNGLTLFFEGMQGGIMYVILTGVVDLYKKSKDDEENIFLVSIKKGDYLGELSLIDEDQRSATAKIAEDSQLLVITRKCFNDMIYKEPEIALKILLNIVKKLSERLKQMNQKMVKLEEQNDKK